LLGLGLHGDISGFFNSASGGSSVNGLMSGIFNVGERPHSVPRSPAEFRDFLNVGNNISGLLSLTARG
jgi:hypothetical protein